MKLWRHNDYDSEKRRFSATQQQAVSSKRTRNILYVNAFLVAYRYWNGKKGEKVHHSLLWGYMMNGAPIVLARSPRQQGRDSAGKVKDTETNQ